MSQPKVDRLAAARRLQYSPKAQISGGKPTFKSSFRARETHRK
jgi:hypothetical protein